VINQITAAHASGEAAGGSANPLLRVSGLAKAFGPTQALRDCSFELQAGEIHALVGENGSGKSTLVKILSGVHAPDAGQIELRGQSVSQLRTPHAAQQRGIVTVFQEVLVAESCSVLDNIWLGIDRTWRTKVSTGDKRRRARDMLTQLLGRPLDLGRPVEELSLSDRQACGIARALLRNPEILILDEGTSALDVATRDRLFEHVTGLARTGVGVIFITHRLDEIERIGDRITVMRLGETVATLERGRWTPRELVRLMTGEDAFASAERAGIPDASERRGPVSVSVRGLKLRQGGAPIDLELHGGELIGVAGLEGHGCQEFLAALRGERVVEGEVVRHLSGEEVSLRSPTQAARCGVACVPRERRLDSLFSWMTIRENFALPTLDADVRMGLISTRASRRRFRPLKELLGIVLRSPEDPITTLSGGNQQKVIVARWLAAGPRILLLNDPTRGIDIGAKADLYALFGALASGGLTIVMLSTELDEHVELMDRVLVFREHALFREFNRSDVSRDALVAAFFGSRNDDQ
jgi:ABC-type sugar transport system ATPase subunit